MKKESGITLIALVITIIVLLILAGVSISLVVGDNGVLTQATNAVEENRKSTALEKIQVEVAGSYGLDGKIDKEQLNVNLNRINGLTYNDNKIDLNDDTKKIKTLPAKVNLNGNVFLISQNGDVKKLINRLPDGYQEVDFLQSTGEQWIDTGVAPKSTTKVIFDFSLCEDNTVTFAYNGWNSGSGREAFMWGFDNGKFAICVDSNNNWYKTDLSIDTERHLISLKSGEHKIDEVVYGNSTIGDTSRNNMYLFARHIGWKASDDSYINGYCKEKVYSCQIYDGDTLVRDFIPGYRTSDNKPGLYDMTNKIFYTNQGSDEEDFTIGPEV